MAFCFYQLGLPVPGVIVLCVIFIMFIFLKDPLIKRINDFSDRKLSFLNRLPGWLKKVIIFLIFLLIFAGIKQATFHVLKYGGIDIEEMILEGIERPAIELSSDLGNESLNKAVVEFLLSQDFFAWTTEQGSKNFCVFYDLYPEEELFPIYIWARCGEFKIVGGEVKELSGISGPVKINYPNELSCYDLSKFSYEVPGNGSLYDEDIKTLFPEEAQERMNFDRNLINQKLLDVVQESMNP